MKHGQAKISVNPPPASQTQQDALKRLEKLSEWSEQPSRDVADAIKDTDPEPTESPRVATKQKKKPEVSAKPWDVAADYAHGTGEPLKSMNFKLPIELYMKLKWLGETTFGTNMTKILTEALYEKTSQMIKDREAK